MMFRDGMPDGKRSREERGMERGEDAGPRHAGLVGVGGGLGAGRLESAAAAAAGCCWLLSFFLYINQKNIK